MPSLAAAFLDHIARDDAGLRTWCRENAAEIAQALRDAERYRWLRNYGHPDSDAGLYVGKDGADTWGNWRTKHYSAGQLDAAIDAARTNEGKP